jgi:predicted nucleotidyltransferase
VFRDGVISIGNKMKEETKETLEKARKTIRLIADKLKESFFPEKIILFGSYAWGLPDEDSDIDILVIKDTEETPHRRNVTARKLVSSVRKGYGLGILVITPEELKSRLEIGDQFRGIREEVNFYYTAEGYPPFVSEPIKEGVAGDLEMAKELVKRILEGMK